MNLFVCVDVNRISKKIGTIINKIKMNTVRNNNILIIGMRSPVMKNKCRTCQECFYLMLQ